MRPSLEDVRQVMSHLPKSALGLDGVPFSVFGADHPATAEFFGEFAVAICEGVESPPEDFNEAILI